MLSLTNSSPCVYCSGYYFRSFLKIGLFSPLHSKDLAFLVYMKRIVISLTGAYPEFLVGGVPIHQREVLTLYMGRCHGGGDHF